MHPPTMGTTLGTGCVLLASMLVSSALLGRPVLHEVLLTLFLVITTPITAILLTRAAIYRGGARSTAANEPAKPSPDDTPGARRRLARETVRPDHTYVDPQQDLGRRADRVGRSRRSRARAKTFTFPIAGVATSREGFVIFVSRVTASRVLATVRLRTTRVRHADTRKVQRLPRHSMMKPSPCTKRQRRSSRQSPKTFSTIASAAVQSRAHPTSL